MQVDESKSLIFSAALIFYFLFIDLDLDYGI